MKNTDTTPRIFLTDYASYNNGTQFEFGHWVDLDDFSDADELSEYISNHFAECDEKSPLGSPREEIMITDFEGFPDILYSESSMDFAKVYAYIEAFADVDTAEDWLSLHNEYCAENNGGDEIYTNDEDFYDTFFSSKDELVRAVFYGDFRYMDEYVMFNGYGNLETFDKYRLEDKIDKNAIIEWKLEQLV